MEAAGCAAAAVQLSHLCVTAVLRLQTLHAKYQTARQTITALHTEVTVIGALMTYIKLIFDKNPDLEKSRFYGNPELGQILTHGLTGCQLVLSCLQEEVSTIMEALDDDDSKARKGKMKYLWREDVMKDLLQTVRGQHAAITSIIQCLQVENITDLGTKVDNLRTVLSGNERGVQKTLSRSSSMANISCQYRIPRKPCPIENKRRQKSADNTKALPQSQHGRSVEPLQQPSLRYPNVTTARVETDTHRSIPSVACSTSARAQLQPTEPTRLDNDAWERGSVLSGISVSSLTERWLESQLSPEATRRTLSRIRDVESCAGEEDGGLSMRAPDTQTFLENVRYFMPCIPESDTDDNLTDEDPIWSRPASQNATRPSPASDTTITPETADRGKMQENRRNGLVVESALRPSSGSPSEIFERSCCVAVLPPELSPRSGCPLTSASAAAPANCGREEDKASSEERHGVADDDEVYKRLTQSALSKISKPTLPAIPSIYTERNLWGCDERASPPDPDIDGWPRSVLTRASSQLNESGFSEKGSVRSLPPISVYSFVG